MVAVFFSYAHADETLRNELEKHLAVVKGQGLIDTWHDRRITAGEVFGAEIDRNLEKADIVLLLFSADFLASDYCYEREALRALERHDAGVARVIPVILRPCDWLYTPFKSLLAAPRDGKPITKWPDRDEAFLDVVSAIRKAAEELKGRTFPIQPSPSVSSVVLSQALPRSSNVRLAKSFTDRDKDRFVDEVFEYVANYFENSLEELKRRNPGIDAQLKRIDTRSFEASIYVDGKRRGICGIWQGDGGSLFGGGILYSSSGISRNSYNESLSIGADELSLFMKPLGISMTNRSKSTKLTAEGAAEYLWSLLIGPLQT